MSRPRRDIRRLWSHPPIWILTLMEQRSTTGLEVCLVCREDCVSMARCTRAGNGTWWLLLRCGACGTWHETFAQDKAVAALQKAITRGVHAVSERVECMDTERMVRQVEAFSQALELDLIGPDDF
jgi:hypothetical protein